MWTGVISGQRISKTDIDAGLLCFSPDGNESGFAGYSAMGTGNNLSNYASFTYQADDGFLMSAIASTSKGSLSSASASEWGMDPQHHPGGRFIRFYTPAPSGLHKTDVCIYLT